jgi:5'-deoxynucleotidase
LNSDFYAVLSRMKYINRWGLMRNTREENLSEHSLETALFAHALVLIHNRRFGGQLDPEHAAVLAMFHDASEIITGDMPTPVKYYNPEIRQAYQVAERAACDRLCSYLPDDLRQDIAPLISGGDEEYRPFVKAADKLSALVKCIEERKAGNHEFTVAERSLREAVKNLNMPEADVFAEEFLPSFALTLDEQGRE